MPAAPGVAYFGTMAVSLRRLNLIFTGFLSGVVEELAEPDEIHGDEEHAAGERPPLTDQRIEQQVPQAPRGEEADSPRIDAAHHLVAVGAAYVEDEDHQTPAELKEPVENVRAHSANSFNGGFLAPASSMMSSFC